MVFLEEVHVFFQLSCIGLLGENRTILHQKNLSFRMYACKTLIQFSHKNIVVAAHASKMHGFLKGFIGFFHLAEEAYLNQNEPLSVLKTLVCTRYSFQTHTQFSQGNDVLDATASNTKGFLLRASCIS
jgi:hypothetical protein